MSNLTMVYAAHGERLLQYQLDKVNARVTLMDELSLDANIQYAVVDSARQHLYVIASDAGAGKSGAKGTVHRLYAFKILANGLLQRWGTSVPLPERPIHLAIDPKCCYLFVAYNQSAFLGMHPIARDGSVGAAVEHAHPPSAGTFTHQVMVCPDRSSVIALARGNDEEEDRSEELGSAHAFSFDTGQLKAISDQSFPAGIGPRHLAFHPLQPWVYIVLERGNKLSMHCLSADGAVQCPPNYQVETLRDSLHITSKKQRGGAVKIHPNGRYLYVSNRSDAVNPGQRQDVFSGGENTLAVFALDPASGEPRLIQHVETQGVEARTLSIEASGQMLIVANQKSVWIEEGATDRRLLACLSFFEIGPQGLLKFVGKHQMPDDGRWLLWLDTCAI
ncbi:lactonase family protein [Pseudomonas sp. 21LCFQ010]|uniref:lactonase family protein n=1 Tax=Pseudomonas sp. 21LCFQ010 TaxID=2957506 RepID=UPI002097E143|nr:beta-propeller fold lactonase family protein [Pseudomonas sp. 21LCFQ010]MCO8161083.1 lactonase family protein [Pseudomonas sp. 21LCFQ010]